VKQSGATNRQRQREAQAARTSEERLAPRRLANLPPEQQAELRGILDAILAGRLRDPGQEAA
jgi:hypothetical protein